MDEVTWAADDRFGKSLPPHVLKGYQAWARPLVKRMRRSPVVNHTVIALATPWVQHMAFKMGVREQDSRIGRVLMAAGWPLCSLIGKLV